MISRGRNKLLILTVLGVIFLVQVILYLIFSQNIRWTELTLLSLILLTAVAGVIFSLRALRKTQKRVSSLPITYQETYIRADEIIGLSGMKRNQKKETMNYILEIFEDASSDNRVVDEVIGYNLEQFVQGLIALPLSIPILLVVILMFVENQQFRIFIDYPVHIFSSYQSVLLGILIVTVSFLLMRFLQNRAIKTALQ